MGVRIVFLGPLAELAGTGEREVAGPLDWDDLCDALGKELAAHVAGDRVRIACAGEVLRDKTTLRARDGDEIALLPPVSGG